MLMLNRAFFSLQSNWIPTVVALGNLFLNALLDFAFYRFGTWGIPLDRARQHRRDGRAALRAATADRRARGRQDAASAARILVASAALAGVAYAVWKPLDELGRTFTAQVCSLALALAASPPMSPAACSASRARRCSCAARRGGPRTDLLAATGGRRRR